MGSVCVYLPVNPGIETGRCNWTVVISAFAVSGMASRPGSRRMDCRWARTAAWVDFDRAANSFKVALENIPFGRESILSKNPDFWRAPRKMTVLARRVAHCRGWEGDETTPYGILLTEKWWLYFGEVIMGIYQRFKSNTCSSGCKSGN